LLTQGRGGILALAFDPEQVSCKVWGTQQATVLDERLFTSPNALGLQHSERTGMLNAQPAWLRSITGRRLVWTHADRDIHPEAQLHPTVLERLGAPHVPQMGKVKPYRPESLRHHRDAEAIYLRSDDEARRYRPTQQAAAT
jgi:hypothetical protein